MKHLLKVTFTLIAAALFTTATAQNTGSYLKYDLNGKTISHMSAELNSYNKFEPGSENTISCNMHVLFIPYLAKGAYELKLTILTPAHTAPVAGKIPYVQDIFLPLDSPCPGAYLLLTKTVGKDYEFYASMAANPGHFEITKVAAGWVEGKFEIDIPKQYTDNGDIIHITNGSFRFKIEKEMKD